MAGYLGTKAVLLSTTAADVVGNAEIGGDLTVGGNLSVDGGTIKLDGNYPVGTNNVALGNAALDAVDSGAIANTAVGHGSATALTSGDENTAVGNAALATATTAINNTAVGSLALQDTTTGGYNVAVGKDALQNNTTASNNTAVGYQAGYSNTTGASNVSVGHSALKATTTGNFNTAVGRGALIQNTTGIDNTAIGNEAGYNNTTGSYNTYLGDNAGADATNTRNTFVGHGSGEFVTTGEKNTILGRYSGNGGGLDIRTASNRIVLSDGDGNPRLHIDDTGEVKIGHNSSLPNLANGVGGDGFSIGVANVSGTFRAAVSASDAAANIYLSKSASPSDNRHLSFYRNGSQVGNVTTTASATAYNTTSDYRLKENVVELTGATDRLKQLNPSRFNFIAEADTTVDGFLAHEVQAVVPEAITGTKDAVDADGNPEYQGIDQSKLVPLLVATIQELEARITALETP